MVAVVKIILSGGETFLKWIKSPITNVFMNKVEESSLSGGGFKPRPTQMFQPRPRPTEMFRPRPRPTPKQTTARTTTEGIKPEIGKCGADPHFLKKKCDRLDLTPFKHAGGEFVFGDGDSLFISIFAGIFSFLGIVLNVLVIVAVVNYRPTRRHVSSKTRHN